ncbi:hypothetical protein AYO44_13370 [Planctomycetaceae bacterium SCGC AG-212-F19]|nr:hypothetical protein AYO44_13370 [Planctomycetaceae bacterium SCGC AG-212-F19]
MEEEPIKSDAITDAPGFRKMSAPLPSQEENPFLLPAGMLICPNCHKPTASLKTYDIPEMYYRIVVVINKYGDYTACPKCMRRRLLQVFLWSFVSLNPFFFLFWTVYLCLFFRSFTRGHTKPRSEWSNTMILLLLVVGSILVTGIALVADAILAKPNQK